MHYVVTIHGIGANKQIFGQLEQALELYRNSDFKISYIAFEYQTGNDQLTTFDFSESLDLFLRKFFSSKKLLLDDKISIVSHSQGGLIAILWLYQAFKDKSPLLPFINSVTTLATPFWGSKIAELGSDVYKMWRKTGKNFFLPTGQKEMSEMTFVSDTTIFIRHLFFAQEFQDFANFLKSTIYFNCIGAYAKSLGNLNYIFGEAGIQESDSAVSIPSARADFYYLYDPSIDYKDNEIMPLERTTLTKLSAFSLVNAIHHTFASIEGPLLGIAQIPKRSLVDFYYHPTLPILMSALDKKSWAIESDENIATDNKLKFFILDFNLVFNEEKIPLIEDIKISFNKLNGERLKWNEISIGWTPFHVADYKRASKQYRNQIRFSFHGQIKNQASSYFLLISIETKEYRTRKIETLVRPSYSTYLDLAMSKE